MQKRADKTLIHIRQVGSPQGGSFLHWMNRVKYLSGEQFLDAKHAAVLWKLCNLGESHGP